MTMFVDAGGMTTLGITCYGGEEEYYAARDGTEPPVNNYRPRIGNIAPRTDGWSPARSNTQTAPRSGPGKDKKPMMEQPRGPMFGRPAKKFLP